MKRKVKLFALLLVSYLMGVATIPFVAYMHSLNERIAYQRTWDRKCPAMKEAQTLAEKAALFVKNHGVGAAREEFAEGQDFFVINDKGVILLYPSTREAEGKNFINMIDIKGNYVFKPMVKVEEEDWFKYWWVDPKTKKASVKNTYAVRVGDLVVGSGVFCE